MGYFYPPPPSFVGGRQPYAPALGIAQSGPIPQAPPLRGPIAAATLGVILAGWQPPFFLAQVAGDIAPTIPAAVASQPPALNRAIQAIVQNSWHLESTTVVSLCSIAPFVASVVSQPPAGGVNLQTVLQAWQPQPFLVQGAGDIAPTLPAPAITTQPLPSRLNLQIIRSAWDTPFFLAQGAGHIAPSLPIISQPQPVSAALLYSIRTTWDPPWLSAYMQGAGDIAPTLPAGIQPSQPPVLTAVNLQTILQAWQPPFAMPQGAGDIAPTLPPAVGPSQPPVPTAVNFETILQSWLPGFVLPQRQQGIATQPIVNASPAGSNSLFFELISANQPPPYALPVGATIASWLPAPTAPSQPPISSNAQLYALVAASQPAFILPPTGDDFAPLIGAPVFSAAPPASLANLRVLLQSWDAIAQPVQPRIVVTASGPIPDPPPPSSRVNLQTIVQLNQPPWNYSQGFGNIAAFPVYIPQVGGPRYVIRRIRARRWMVSSVSYSQFDIKAPDESIKLTFDFEPDLPAGITLSGTPTITITTTAGADSLPSLVGNGTAGADPTNSQIIVPVAAGLDACDYKVHVRVATSDPLIVLSLSGILPVRT